LIGRNINFSIEGYQSGGQIRISYSYFIGYDFSKRKGAWEMSPTEIILREAEKLPWYEWQCIVKAMEFVHRKRADKLTLDDSEKTHEELMFHVEHY